MSRAPRPLPWLEAGDDFPPVSQAWAEGDPAPGLLAGGGALDLATLERAYRAGIFPWFSEGQPVLWWSPDPRMVLPCASFRLHRSLKQTLRRFRAQQGCEVRIDSAFHEVIEACAESPRTGQSGTWINPPMVLAYQALHQHGLAHSVETWVDGCLVGGLYCVSVGRAVFGESMFARRTDASKVALSALVAFCRAHAIDWIDCQQQTQHLASLGAVPWPRSQFLDRLAQARVAASVQNWHFDPIYWNHLF
jgi:leucyl/phenylalanyl-tRNA--protein transferase